MSLDRIGIRIYNIYLQKKSGWRNWQTHQSQKLASTTLRGSSPLPDTISQVFTTIKNNKTELQLGLCSLA